MMPGPDGGVVSGLRTQRLFVRPSWPHADGLDEAVSAADDAGADDDVDDDGAVLADADEVAVAEVVGVEVGEVVGDVDVVGVGDVAAGVDGVGVGLAVC
jgi:hypothetical protein